MKTIIIKCSQDGKISTNNDNLILSKENESVKVTIDYGNILPTYTKRADIYVDYDETYDFVTGTIANQLVFNLTNAHLKQGIVMIQPVAYLDGDAEYELKLKEKWQYYQFKVAYSINTSDSSTHVDEQLGVILQGEIDAVEERATVLESQIVNDVIQNNGANSMIDELNFDTTPTSTDALLEGQLRWNTNERTLDIGVDGSGVVMQVGQETHYPKTVNTGLTAINDGDLVMYNGTTGGSGVINIKKYDPAALTLSGQILGVATENIAINAQGKVTYFGLINGVQTNGVDVGEVWADGQILYNHPTLVGKMSKTKPVAPINAVTIGIVVRAHATTGILLIRPIYFPQLGQLSNVAIANPINGDVLIYNSTLGRWDNSSILSTPRWTDLTFPFTQTKVGSNLKPDFDFTNVGLLFPQNDVTEIAYITCQMPHSWKEGSDINPHIHCVQKANQQATFIMEYKWYNVGDLEPSTWSTHTLNKYSATYVSGSLSQIIEGQTMIAGTGKKVSSILKIKLYRNDNVYTGDFFADQFDIHYQQDSFGSVLEYVK